MPARDSMRVKLAAGTTMAKYRELEAQEDRAAIASFIYNRFTERYLAPLSATEDKMHGFTIMAVACLTVEALESFRNGWPDTNKKSKAAFRSFFEYWPEFSAFAPIADDFYFGIRCGILHQAETTRGWLIRKSGHILDPANKTINARAFLVALNRVLDSYCDELVARPWDDELWKALRNKMKAVCKNAEA